jgi:glycosyltransferase involved in cell wall biosynthesis
MLVLSILICSLPERTNQLTRLLTVLDKQVNQHKIEVEYLIDFTPRGMMTTGFKRNELLYRAKGEYVCYVDDDDLVSTDYVSKILAAAKCDSDCIGIVGILKRKGRPDWTFRHSITVDRWCKDKEKKIYFRTPNHLNPIKRRLADLTGFNNLTIGEDRDYSDRIKSHLKTETFIEGPIYYYLK